MGNGMCARCKATASLGPECARDCGGGENVVRSALIPDLF